MKKAMLLPTFLLLAMMAHQAMAQVPPSVVVGRAYDVENDLLRYIPEENDWAPMMRDAPFGAGDALYSGSGGRTELIVPNGSLIRIGNSTQMQFVAMGDDVTEANVAGGTTRFYNRGANTVIKATTPYGYVLAYPGTIFDLYVGENSAETVALQGTVSFIHAATNARYDIAAGGPSVLADQNQVGSGQGTPDEPWDAWNAKRDDFWSSRAMARSASYQYLPPALRDDAVVLEQNGQWTRVYYEGGERLFWRPTRIPAGWAPFTDGRWVEWCGDQTWIPAEPFGYVTHHYGNWVLVGNSWYWAPPVAGPARGRPFLDVPFAWNPGRVSWIYRDGYVGWVPLAPHEVYYCRHNWGGPHSMVVTGGDMGRIAMDPRRFAYAGHAVVVSQNNFYGVRNYRTVRETNINTTVIVNNYHAAPVISDRVIANYATTRQRYSPASAAPAERPRPALAARIIPPDRIAATAPRVSAEAISQQAKTVRPGRPAEAHVAPPRAMGPAAPEGQAGRPRPEGPGQRADIKGPPQARPGQPGQMQPTGQPQQQGPSRPAGEMPMRPVQQGPQQPREPMPARPNGAPQQQPAIRPIAAEQAQAAPRPEGQVQRPAPRPQQAAQRPQPAPAHPAPTQPPRPAAQQQPQKPAPEARPAQAQQGGQPKGQPPAQGAKKPDSNKKEKDDKKDQEKPH